MKITAQLLQVRYQKEIGNWGIYLFFYNGNTILVTGCLSKPVAGAFYSINGQFETHPKYGDQFKASKFCIADKVSAKPYSPTVAPNERGIIAYLSSSATNGIGKATARAIVKQFGNDTLNLIRSDDYMRLTEVPGVGESMADKLHDHLPPPCVEEDLRMLLGDEVTDLFISKIVKQYGDDSPRVVRENPYRMIEDLPGVGFQKADKIAKAAGIADDAMIRVKAAVYYFLSQEADMNGHCYSYSTNLQANLQELIPGVSVERIADAIKEMNDSLTAKKMSVHVDVDGAIYLKSLYLAETRCADFVNKALDNPVTNPCGESMVASAAAKIKKETGVALESTQLEAVRVALNNRISVITGGPGTGKTTIIRTILKAIEMNDPYAKTALMAPTGRAAVRMASVTEHEASTIHKRLSLKYDDPDDPSPKIKGRPIEEDFIIVDESSMIDIRLASYLLNNVRDDAQIVFIGDADQLPPVGPGAFFRDLVTSYRVPTVRLKVSFRQSGFIAANAVKVNYGEGVHGYAQDDTFRVISATKRNGPEKAIAAYLAMEREYGPQEAILLAPTRKRGDGGANALNNAIQEIVNPAKPGKREIKIGSCTFREGDRVMLLSNLWKNGLANGDTGTIAGIAKESMTVSFDGGTDAEFSFDELSSKNLFSLAYASTVHKSQGSEYNGVVFLFTTEHTFMGERNIVYTALTRAKEKIRLVCDARAINTAIDTVKPLTRNSKLKDRINDPS